MYNIVQTSCHWIKPQIPGANVSLIICVTSDAVNADEGETLQAAEIHEAQIHAIADR